ncbi:MAG: class II aldolase/adducin family protein [Acutalibacteraceae bacterium]|jgi:L-fuculose-phosphate aldolase|nr:class II aldolase/adducin family protein [Clostridiales bacterium]
MNYKKLIVESGLRMLNSGYTVETWGNISFRDKETNLVYLTPSGMDYTIVTQDDIVVCDLDGNIVEGTKKPTIETGLHLAIYKARPEVNAVVHTHPMYSMVFSCCGEDIPLVIDEAAQTLGGTVKTAEYALPGSPELAQNCVEALGTQSNACLLKSHGAVCVGEDMDSAFKVSKVLEVTAEIYQMIRAIGKTPYKISDENIAAMQDFVKNVYGQR